MQQDYSAGSLSRIRRATYQSASGLFLLLFLALVGCTKTAPTTENDSTPPSKSETFTRTVTDSRGKSFTLKLPPQRIVSLAPSNTEILFALGLEKRIAAVTNACDYPVEAKKLPNVGGYPYSIESILVKNPDLVVTEGSLKPEVTDALEKGGIPVLAIMPKNLKESYEAIQLLGKATGTEKEAEQIVSKMQSRFGEVSRLTANVKTKPKVFILYQTNPIYTTGPGTVIDELITIAGGENIVKEKIPNNIISSERVLLAAPDVLICSPMMRDGLKQIPGWSEGIPALKNGRFYDAPNSASLARPGPRLAEAAESLARYLHPELFPK